MARSKGKINDDHYHVKDSKIISRIFELHCNLIKPQLLLLICLPACSGWSQQLWGTVLASL